MSSIANRPVSGGGAAAKAATTDTLNTPAFAVYGVASKPALGDGADQNADQNAVGQAANLVEVGGQFGGVAPRPVSTNVGTLTP